MDPLGTGRWSGLTELGATGKQIEAAVGQVQAALSTEDSQTKVGDLAKLKAARERALTVSISVDPDCSAGSSGVEE